MLKAVADAQRGRFVVETASGTRYVLDLDGRLVQRTPTALTALPLRRDGEDVELLKVLCCRLGEPLVVLIDLDWPGVFLTTRTSTAVVRIDPVPTVSAS